MASSLRSSAALRAGGVLLLALLCGTSVSAQPKPPEPMPTAELQALAAVYDLLKTSLADNVGGDKLVLASIKGMVQEVDPEGGEYFTEEEFKALRNGSPGGPGSIGVELSRRGQQTVLLPLAGMPASAAGVRAGDLLVAIDGKSLRGMGLTEAVAMLRGAVGSKVRLTLWRAFATQPTEVEIERQVLARRDLSVSRPEPDLVVLRVHALGERLLQDLAQQLDAQCRQQPCRGLVLDLRGNPGGVLTSAVGLAAAFLPRSVVVATTRGRMPSSNQTWRADPADYAVRLGDPLRAMPASLRQLPMVVLVDGGTASGAEIVAAALQAHQRALVVGHTTFGRGSIQTMVPLQGKGAVKFTSAYWESPTGARLHGVGVKPDLDLSEGDDAQELAAAISALKKRLPS